MPLVERKVDELIVDRSSDQRVEALANGHIRMWAVGFIDHPQHIVATGHAPAPTGRGAI